ncbi:PilW family protein [Paracidovorax cattleyae]|uniref:PilW family protein n=1 Tax=Paracidovorax cattleyae TaxID=80868 RepID=UPI0018B00BF9|nr:PilW family protein [Paracidovorax cattleyae]MBF9264763.1 PilW family protein [Paracidovorax cattleyae]
MSRFSKAAGRRGRQRGLTLVELMVAMVISLLIVLAATVALVVARQGFNNVDAASQLRDNARFVEDMVQRLGVQAGYRDLFHAAYDESASTSGLDPSAVPNTFVYGFNNKARTGSDNWYQASTARTSGSVGYGSDVLVLRFQPATSNSDATKTDNAMIDCSGYAPAVSAKDRYDRVASVLHVDVSNDGEPALMCTRWYLDSTNTLQTDTGPLISGVEDFQVLYGVDGIPANNATMPAASTVDSVQDRFLRADQITVSDPLVSAANWRRVRSIRIGMVLRGAPNSAVDRTSQTYYPLGTAKGSSGGAIGSMFADDTNDPGAVFTPTADGRLRQVVTFTVHLRNNQREPG